MGGQRSFSITPRGLGNQLQVVRPAPPAALRPALAPTSHCCLLGRPLLPTRLHHLLNCVTASLLSPSLAQAQPWCRYPAALQARQHRLSFFLDRSPPASPAPGDGHSGCSSLSSTRNIRGIRSVVRLMTSSHTVMASWCLPACSKADAASRNTSGILGRAEPPSRGTWGARAAAVLRLRTAEHPAKQNDPVLAGSPELLPGKAQTQSHRHWSLLEEAEAEKH